MSILSFDKPKKIRSTEKHNKKFSSDSGIAGTYVPNMSEDDKLKWKAKYIIGDDERIEIRKTINGVQLLIVVYKKEYHPPKPEFPEYDGGSKDFYWEQANIIYRTDNERYAKRHENVRISMNGKLDIGWNDLDDMNKAINEAYMKLV
jgi:hypothetical protein